MDYIKNTSKINGVNMYTYGLSDDDMFGRTSLTELYNKGQISEIDYKSTVMSSGSILLEDCYWNQFPVFKTTFTMPKNYTPKGYIREGGKLVNLKQRQDEKIKLAKKKVPTPYVVVRNADGRVELVPRQGYSA